MDDSFRLRVEKIFGSLTNASSSSSSSKEEASSALQSTLWSLTDDEVEKREWRKRETVSPPADRDEMPCSSSFDCLKRDRMRRIFRRELEEDDLDDFDDDGRRDDESNRLGRGGDAGGDEWEIRSSIGLDRTLDNEEEEDEYDRVASGRENAGDLLYMKDVASHDSYLNIENVLPKSFHCSKDPRANRLAARIRLREDEAEARNLSSHDFDGEAKQLNVKPCGEDGGQLRSILKRKDNSTESKPLKRVRFDPSCKVECEKEASKEVQKISISSSPENAMVSDGGSLSRHYDSRVPDYMRNPSKYTCYSFDTTGEADEKSNSQAFVEFLKLVKQSRPIESELELKDFPADLTKPITFVPKKKASKVPAVNHSTEDKQGEEDDSNQSLNRRSLAIGIAAQESQESDNGQVEEEETKTNGVDRNDSFRKPSRRFRARSSFSDIFEP